MTTYNTGNPIGSKDPRDLYDNSENLDVAVNDDAATWIDRFGVQRSTLWQMLEYSKQFNDRGDWLTGTAYARKDYFTYGGVTYVTLTAHTSTSVAADLAAGKIGVMSGNSGAMDFLQAGTGAVKRSVESKLRDVVSVLDFGADNTGATPCTTQVAAAYAHAVSSGGALYFPPGTYLGQFLFSGEAPVHGAGIRRTVLKPTHTTSYCVKVYGAGLLDEGLGAILTNLSITSSGKIGKGLECGDRTASTGCSNARFDSLEISGFQYNIFMSASNMSTFRQVYSSSGTYGIYFDGAANVTTLHFDTCRFRLNDYGIYARSGMNITWTNCNAESNGYVNLWAQTSQSTGPAEWIFNTCWFENLLAASGERYGLFFDMVSTIGLTKPMNFRFNYCVISTPQGLPDIRADRAQDVIFDHCCFSDTADGYTSAKFSFAGTGAVRIRLKDCGKIQALPSEEMYANFPALASNAFGFAYEFYDSNNIFFTNAPSNVATTGTFTPTIVGTTSAGTGTYTTAKGRYTKIGNRVLFDIRLAWSSHTGTGNMNVSGLPFVNSSSADFSYVNITPEAITLTAGNVLQAKTDSGTNLIVLRQYPTGGGALTAVPIDTAGALYISGHYEI